MFWTGGMYFVLPGILSGSGPKYSLRFLGRANICHPCLKTTSSISKRHKKLSYVGTLQYISYGLVTIWYWHQRLDITQIKYLNNSVCMKAKLVFLNPFYTCVSKITVGEWTWVHSNPSSLLVTQPTTDQGRRVLTSVLRAIELDLVATKRI